MSYPPERRKQVAEILRRQNQDFGASARTLENISAFANGALALVTGQQVGLFGGPAFSLYKALSAVKLTDEARKLGLNCVPVFWLATEDHDFAEVNQFWTFDRAHQAVELKASDYDEAAIAGRPVKGSQGPCRSCAPA